MNRCRVRFHHGESAWWMRFVLAGAVILLGAAATRRVAAAPMQDQEMTLPEADEQAVQKYSWVPDLLYGIIDSPNLSALDAFYDAAFAAGPALVPPLQTALADDRTAEFAAQSLAFIGGDQAIRALAKLVNDPRDLDLRQYYYGALGADEAPGSREILIHEIRDANNEPDRAVTDAAIVALTARSDTDLVAPLEQAEAKLTDPVIQEDLLNAISIIQSRARYLAGHSGPSGSTSIEQALRIYFVPAIQSSAASAAGNHGKSDVATSGSGRKAGFQIRHLEYSPAKDRALARVIFEDPEAIAHYWIVLQRKGSSWGVDTAWLGAEEEKPESPAAK
jgi:hypothetical protein